MSIKSPNREIPDQLREVHDKLASEGLVAYYAQKYDEAEKLFAKLLQALIDAQKSENRPIHKGLPLHNMGLAMFGQGKTADAINNILLAYIEDTLNTGYDFEDDADRTLAARMLRDVFYFNLRILREIKVIVAEIKKQGKWNDAREPKVILDEAARRLGFDTNKLLEQCQRKIEKIGKSLMGFPEPRERRVFIGTNYDANPGVIPILREAVIRKGYVPVVVADVAVEEDAVHDTSILLLHTCAYAIIDVTNPGGQFMEIERVRDYGTKLLLVKQALDTAKPRPASGMVASLKYDIEYYSDPRDLFKFIADFLP